MYTPFVPQFYKMTTLDPVPRPGRPRNFVTMIWSALHTHVTDIESSNAKFSGNLYLLTGKMLKCLLKKNTFI